MAAGRLPAKEIKTHPSHSSHCYTAITGGSTIVEHTTHDAYWGDGGDGTGKNMLGVILMEVRRELREGHAGDRLR